LCPLGNFLIVHDCDMYCSLEDAFPQKIKNPTRDPPEKKKTFASSCWYNAAEPVTPPPSKENHQVILGANVQKKETGAGEDQCFTALHHCLSCKTCQHLLSLHFQAANGQESPAVVMGAQVGRRRSHRRKSHRQRVPLRGATAILNEPITTDSNITWGHILVLLVGGAFILLIVDRLKK